MCVCVCVWTSVLTEFGHWHIVHNTYCMIHAAQWCIIEHTRAALFFIIIIDERECI